MGNALLEMQLETGAPPEKTTMGFVGANRQVGLGRTIEAHVAPQTEPLAPAWTKAKQIGERHALHDGVHVMKTIGPGRSHLQTEVDLGPGLDDQGRHPTPPAQILFASMRLCALSKLILRAKESSPTSIFSARSMRNFSFRPSSFSRERS